MATRPVFIPLYSGPQLIKESLFEFEWTAGFAEIQKKKNILALHQAAEDSGISTVLEISSKSDIEIGRRLSAFSLKIKLDGHLLPLESIYQSSKVFRDSGPFPEIQRFSPREAKKFIRENSKGDLLRFNLCGEDFPLWPKNAFYDWLYIRSLITHDEWIKNNMPYSAFTDIEFNPKTQVNCQARAFAEYLSLQKRSLLKRASEDFIYFSSLLNPG